MSAFDPIFLLLRQKIGLDAASLGARAVELAVTEAMTECGLREPAEYHAVLVDKPRVLNHLVEKLVVPETWFFRDQIPFDVLQALAKSRASSGEVFRVASIPCSTGEEPYSIAMTLLEAGFAPGSFVVDAVDLSEVSLERARRAVYGPISFRGAKPGFREKYFRQEGNYFTLNSEIRNCVQFHHGNLVDPFLLKGREGYEVIFCRNVLIYLDEAGRAAALESFKRLLLPGGLLFVGHAETLQIFNRNFRLLPEASSFGYVYLGAEEIKVLEPRSGGLPARPVRSGAVKPRLPAAAVRTASIPPPPRKENKETVPVAEGGELKAIAELADRGQLDQALEQCAVFLQKSKAVAQAHFLMGIIRAAKGQPGLAEEALRRALYLEPQHHEALIHLSLLLEKKGDRQGAALARQRAERSGKDRVPA